MTTLAPGAQLGPYQILAALGSGGMGEVWRARDTRLGRDVALKALRADLRADPTGRARFEREARAVAALSHPNIVTIYAFEEFEGLALISMETVDGRSLDQELPAGGMALADLVDITLAVSEALISAHEHGVVHRDLKPSNVVLTRDRRVKVLDFGLAKLFQTEVDPDATVAMTRTHPGQAVGTVPYMSPEQLRGTDVDARTDVFALGVLMYELAAGVRPFRGASASEVVSAILRDAPEPLRARRGDVPAGLERLVGRCLEKDPRDRFQTVRDVFNELRILKRESESGLSSARTPVSSGTVAAQDLPSIAVLPFVNLSRDEENEYFCDGLAEELINVLFKVKQLRVAARTSSFVFKGRQADVETIGRQLKVGALLEGSVRRAGQRVRISAQLVQVSDGSPMWSETYDRELDDVFAVQDDIAQSVVKELRSALLGERPDSGAAERARADVRAAVANRTENPEAHREYMIALHFERRFTHADLDRAVAHFTRAVELDPGYARAWAGLARAHATRGGFGWMSLDEATRAARTAVERALELAPDLPEAHAVRGLMAQTLEWNWDAAAAALEHALEGAPDEPLFQSQAARLYLSLGRWDEALALARRAVDRDPLNARAHSALGHCLWTVGKLDEAVEVLRASLVLNPDAAVTRTVIATVLMDAGRYEESLELARAEREPGFRAMSESVALHALGRHAESDAVLAQLIEQYANDMGMQIALAYSMRGDLDHAFEWLDRARDARDTGISEIPRMPAFRRLHGDPRWQRFLDSIHWPSAARTRRARPSG